ncbi:MAG TPA: phosphate signaling complex protein PhoU [bacterium]|nr:phosphate signaling complex protein PhoU [bacterium]
MERHFDEELKALKKNILNMASMVDELTGRAIKALKERDEALAEEVEKADEVVDLLEIEIDKQCLDLMARRQPLAIDLRFITSVMKINNDLERIGDLATTIAHKSRILLKYPPLKPLIDIPRMADMVREMIKESVNALVERDSVKAMKIIEMDNEVDSLYVQVFREILTYMMENNENIKSGIELILIAKYIERMADHVTNIAEDIVYMIEGKTIKHGFETIDRAGGA